MWFKNKWVMLVICVVLSLGTTLLVAALAGKAAPQGALSGDSKNDTGSVEEEVIYDPDTVEALLQEGFYMYDTMKIFTNETLKGGFALRAGVHISSQVYNYVKSNPGKTFGMLIVPYDYVESAPFDGDKLAWHDYLAENDKGTLETVSTVHREYDEDGLATGFYYSHFSMINVLESNYNRKFTAIAYIKTVNGDEVTYEYARYNEGYDHNTFARSPVNLAAEVLDRALRGEISLSDHGKSVLNGVVQKTVYLISKLDEEFDASRNYLAGAVRHVYEDPKIGDVLMIFYDAYLDLDVTGAFIETPFLTYPDIEISGITVERVPVKFPSNEKQYIHHYFSLIVAGYNFYADVVFINRNYTSPDIDPAETVYWLTAQGTWTEIDKSYLGNEEYIDYFEYYEHCHDECETSFYWYALEGCYQCPGCDKWFELVNDEPQWLNVTRGEELETCTFLEADGWFNSPALEEGKLYFVEGTLFRAGPVNDVSGFAVVPVGTVFTKDGEIYTVTDGCEYIFLDKSPLVSDFSITFYAVIGE